MSFKITSRLFIFLGLLISILSQAQQEAPKRLIETAPGQARWMTPQEIESISHARHSAGRCGGFVDITDHQDLKATQVRSFDILQRAQLNNSKLVTDLVQKVSVPNLEGTVKKLSSYPTRHYSSKTGVESANWIKNEFVRMAGERSDISVTEFKHSWAQPSIIARIQGKTKPQEIVILGGHQDSINHTIFDMSKSAPGADDNASGIATLLETFRILTEAGYQPERTIEFMAYAAEEVGLWGSQDIAKTYQKNKANVVGVVQFDMTMYPSGNKDIVFMSDFTDPNLTNFTKQLVDSYVKIKWATDQCGYGCSDHASWTKAGYPSVMPFEATMSGMNPKIHTKGDKFDQLDTDFGANFAKLALAFAVELGSP